MTDEQIVKALECCASSYDGDACDGCPFNDNTCDEDSNALSKYALELIKQQKADIKDLIKQRDEQFRINQQVVRRNGQHIDERNRLKAEIESLKRLCASKDVIINSQEAEIMQNENRFPHFTEDTQVVTVSKKADGQYYADRVTTIQVDKIRTEAIKEFAEKIKERKYQSSDWSHGEHPFVVEEDDIDDVLWKMTEGSNGE